MSECPSEDRMRVLVVDDNRDILRNIGDYLELFGHVLDFAFNGPQALHLALVGEYDVIVLDLMLPGMDGLDVCRELRAGSKSEVPVLMLTARDTLPDKLDGFRAGTDDYLVKPFAMQELLARLHALHDRRKGHRARRLVVGDLTLDKGTREVSRGGQPVALNPVGFRILEKMMEASPTIVNAGRTGDAPVGRRVSGKRRVALARVPATPDHGNARRGAAAAHGPWRRIPVGGSR